MELLFATELTGWGAHGAAGRARVAECSELSRKMDELESIFVAEVVERRGAGHAGTVA